jgi:hypothetical protein
MNGSTDRPNSAAAAANTNLSALLNSANMTPQQQAALIAMTQMLNPNARMATPPRANTPPPPPAPAPAANPLSLLPQLAGQLLQQQQPDIMANLQSQLLVAHLLSQASAATAATATAAAPSSNNNSAAHATAAAAALRQLLPSSSTQSSMAPSPVPDFQQESPAKQQQPPAPRLAPSNNTTTTLALQQAATPNLLYANMHTWPLPQLGALEVVVCQWC